MRKRTLIAGGLLAGLLAAEVVCRLVVPNPLTASDENRSSWRVQGLVADPDVEYSFQPGYAGRMALGDDYDVPFRINGQGLRADQDFAPEHPGVARILLVGDSFVFGIGVELPDTLGGQLERALSADGQGPVQVVSVGVPSYGLDDYAKLVERWVPRLQPDLVVIALFPGNDLIDYDAAARNRHVVIDGMLLAEDQAGNWALRRWSVLAHTVMQRLRPKRWEGLRSPNPSANEIATIYKSMQPWLRRLVEAPGPDGPPLAVWVIEGKSMLEQHRRGKLEDTVPPQAWVLAALRKAGVQVFDPAEAWVAAGPVASAWFFPRDPHYTPAGSHFMSEWLAPRLRTTYATELSPD